VVGEGATREAVVRFELNDPSVISNHAKAIDIADQLFGRIVMAPAEEGGFKRAAVHLLASAGGSTPRFEDFHYARRDDSVWLRQAGREPWKTAQNPADWAPPQSQAITLPMGDVYVDFIGSIFPPPGRSKSLGIEMRSDVPVSNAPAKYMEIKQLWEQGLDIAAISAAGFDHVRFENYGEPRRGKFQVRKMAFVNISRLADGNWPALPDRMPSGALPVSALHGETVLAFGTSGPALRDAGGSEEPLAHGGGLSASAAEALTDDYLNAGFQLFRKSGSGIEAPRRPGR
jgi:hypothetical protein